MYTSSKTYKFTFIATCCLGLGACSFMSSVPGVNRIVGDEGYFRDRQGDYLAAESIPRLNIPDSMDAYIIDDLLVIPDVVNNQGQQAILDVPRPRPLQGNPDRAVVIQRLGDRSWVVVDAAASQVWPRVRQYWLEQGVELVQENPATGRMDTTWFQNGDNVDTQDKIRVFVRPGFQDDSSEISLIHLSVPRDRQVFEQVNWPQSSMDPEYAYDVLTDISTYIADQIRLYQASTVSFLAGTISDAGRASIQNQEGGEVLHLDADYERSWSAVGRALDRAEVTILEENMEAGYYQVSFSERDDQEQQDGFFSRLLSRNDEETFPFRVDIQQTDDGINVHAEAMMPSAGTDDAGQQGESESMQQQEALKRELLETIHEFIT